ncbi:MAG: hypothetical protein P4L73_16320 [Caulobacteraceae bacterium]|nr:hypothetical protein [Caulobacteraceae bacterium]
MKFTLTYDGELPSTGNGGGVVKRQQKWDIRKHFAPQLEELWRVHPALKQTLHNRRVPRAGPFLLQDVHHEDEAAQGARIARSRVGTADLRDLCEPISKGGRQFFPLVRSSLALGCGLKVLFLRREGVGRVYQGGDIDGRVKTLLDALSVPVDQNHVFPDPTLGDAPIYCLLEDDSLISGLNIETERLLSAPNAAESVVKLVIEVDVRVTDSRAYNHSFLGN